MRSPFRHSGRPNAICQTLHGADADGTNLKVYCFKSPTVPNSWSDATDKVFESSNFDFSAGGGLFGFTGPQTLGDDLAIDDFTLNTDRDANGSFETTEHIDDFTIDTNGIDDAQPTHDAAGNLTFDGVHQFTYDAWNRLIEVEKAFRDPTNSDAITAGSTVNTIQYDGLNRRIVKTIQNSGQLDMTLHYYYDGQRVIEERDLNDQVIKQYAWAASASGYVDELVQIAVNQDPVLDDAFDPNDPDHDRADYYALQDANFNVLGIVDTSGDLIERFEYTPYGRRQVYTSAGSNDPLCNAPTTIGSRAALTGGTSAAYALCSVGHQGLIHDEETGNIHVRNRYLLPRIGRMSTHDGAGYAFGANLYQYEKSNPINHLDPSGDVIIFVHGILNYNLSDSRLMHTELWRQWRSQRSVPQAWIHFKYGKPPGLKDASQGIESDVNKAAGTQLANLINSLKAQIRRLGCDEPIYLIGYSNGSNVIYNALKNNGASVDRVLFLGGSISHRLVQDQQLVGRAGEIVNFSSATDQATGFVGGGGKHGTATASNSNVETLELEGGKLIFEKVNNVFHSANEAYDNGFHIPSFTKSRVQGHTQWLTQYMVANHYAEYLHYRGNCCLSRRGSITPPTGGNITLRSNWQLYDSGVR